MKNNKSDMLRLLAGFIGLQIDNNDVLKMNSQQLNLLIRALKMLKTKDVTWKKLEKHSRDCHRAKLYLIKTI